MIKIDKKEDCCGCNACVQRCPKHCIAMVEDQEGFSYPRINSNLCVDCGLCEKICPKLNIRKRLNTLGYFAVKNNNESERLASSSGGVFILLAKEIISSGGVVFGAVYDENWEVHHVSATNLVEVFPMVGSKYVQGRIEDSYKQAEDFLKKGRKVLFTGSPCQIAGLRSFLRFKEYSNLLAVDFLCHGVPSPGIWRQYLAESFGGYNRTAKMSPKATDGKNTVLFQSLNAKSPIGDIKFRDKTDGWKKYRFVVRQKSASKADQNSVLSSVFHYDNEYMNGFLNDIYLRPSCYHCTLKNGASHSDMTIADYWAAKVVDKDFDDDTGLGLVILYSEKGRKVFAGLDLTVREVSSENAHLYNGGFNEHTLPHPKRAKFFRMISCGYSVSDSVTTCLKVSFIRRNLRRIKTVVKKILNRA